MVATLTGMTSPLIPQLRPDKNGKLVTRHVKTDTAGGGAASRIPAPKMMTASKKGPTREQAIDDLAQIISEPPANPTRFTNTPSLRNVTLSLQDFKDDSMFQKITDAMESPESSRFLKGLITAGFYYQEPRLEGYLKAAIDLDSIYTACQKYGDQMPSQFQSDFSNMFSEMGFKESEFKGEITDEHIAYMKATMIANKLGIHNSRGMINNIYYKQIESIKDDLDRIVPALPVLVPVLSRDYYKESYSDIVEVMDEMDKLGHDPIDIGDTMAERGLHDLGLVNEILNNGVKAVSSGVL